MTEQLTFLKPSIDERLRSLEEKYEKTRKSLYAKNGELTKRCMNQEHEIETLKSALARCGLKVGINQSITFFTIEGK